MSKISGLMIGLAIGIYLFVDHFTSPPISPRNGAQLTVKHALTVPRADLAEWGWSNDQLNRCWPELDEWPNAQRGYWFQTNALSKQWTLIKGPVDDSIQFERLDFVFKYQATQTCWTLSQVNRSWMCGRGQSREWDTTACP